MRGPLAQLELKMGAIDLAGLAEADLRGLISDINRGHARIEGYLTRVARELRAREAAGAGPAAEDVLRDEGNVSADRAGAVNDRAGLSELFPGLGAKVESGAARTENADQVAKAVARLTETERSRLAAQDGEIAERATTDSPETFARYLGRQTRAVKDRPSGDGASAAEREKQASVFAMGRRVNGRWWLNGDLDHERAAEINDLVNQRARQLAGDQPVAPRHRAAALHDLIVNGVGGDGAGRARMGIGYILDARTLFHGPHHGTVAETWAGADVDPEAVRRLACDADLYAVVLDDLGQPVAVGRTHRSATREQRLALRALYRYCPIDGTTPFERCEIHHVNIHYEQGGVTDLHNLVPVSLAWHHRIHDRGWTLKMLPDRTLKLWRPDGTLHRIIPPPKPITRQRE